jgi:hypothetical protein
LNGNGAEPNGSSSVLKDFIVFAVTSRDFSIISSKN